MEEIIELIVKFKVTYPDKSRRQEAIEIAKECATSTSIFGTVGCVPKYAKVNKPKCTTN